MLEGIVIGFLTSAMIVLVLGMYGFYKWVGRPRGADELLDPQAFNQHIENMKRAIEHLETQKVEAKKELVLKGTPVPESLLDTPKVDNHV